MRVIKFDYILLFFFVFYDHIAYAGKLQQEIRKFGSYRVIIERSPDKMSEKLTVYQGIKKVFEESEIGAYYFFGNHFDNSPNTKDIYSGKDINGNKIPDLLISHWTGGAHCCHFLSIFELGKAFRKIVTVDGGSYGFKLIDLDKDKILEIEFWDNPIDYLFASFADSAQGRTILKFNKDSYKVSSKLMKRPAPGLKELKKIQLEIELAFKEEKDRSPNFPYLFLKYMMDLSYSGHLQLALKIAEKSWPSHGFQFPKFKKEFLEYLGNSSYWIEYSRQFKE